MFSSKSLYSFSSYIQVFYPFFSFCIWYEVKGLTTFLHMDISFPSIVCQSDSPFPLNGHGILVRNHLTIYAGPTSGISSVPLICMPVFMLVSHCFDYYSCSKLDIRKCETSNFLLLFQDCFDNLRPLEIPYEVFGVFFCFCKNAHWDLIELQ